MKNKYTLKIKNKVKNRASITMYGNISKFDISAEMVQDLINQELDETNSELDIYISSGGGDVFEGIAIYNILRRLDKKITMYVDGIAASIASIIILAADEVVMGEGSQIMVHLPWAIDGGNKNDFMGLIDRLEMVENEMVKIYKNRTDLSDTEITNMMNAETWFNDDKAVEFGFADKKIENNDVHFGISASINQKQVIQNCHWIRKKELAKTNIEFKNKLTETINKFNDVLARK